MARELCKIESRPTTLTRPHPRSRVDVRVASGAMCGVQNGANRNLDCTLRFNGSAYLAPSWRIAHLLLVRRQVDTVHVAIGILP